MLRFADGIEVSPVEGGGMWCEMEGEPKMRLDWVATLSSPDEYSGPTPGGTRPRGEKGTAPNW